MTDQLLHARLFNAGGELIVEGPCWLDEAEGRATLEPEHEPGVIQKERGAFSLVLDSGRTLPVSDTPMIMKLGTGPNGDIAHGHRSLYRFRLLEAAQEANVAGAVADGSAASSQTGLRNGETPAPR